MLALLVGSNAWLVRRQFPDEERRRNEAYDLGLRALADDRDWEEAERQFLRYLALDPRHVRVRYFLGAALKEQGKLAEAAREFEACLEADPNQDEALIGLAEVYWSQQNFLQSLRMIERATRNPPTPAMVYVLKARILSAVGDQDGALRAYGRALSQDSGNYESQLGLADILANRALLDGSTGDRELAAGHYQAAVEICRARGGEGEEKSITLALAKGLAGMARMRGTGELAEAVELLQALSETFPDDPEPRVLVGRFFRRLEQREEARRWLLAARQDFPDDIGLLTELHDLYVELEDPAQAVGVLQEAVVRNPADTGPRVKLIGYLATEERFEEAQAELKGALDALGGKAAIQEVRGDLGRERARALERLGDTRSAAEQRKLAVEGYREALNLRPNSLRIKKKLAGELIEQALGREPGAEPTEAETEARRYLEEALEVFPADGEALAWKSKLLLLDGRDQEVVESLRPTLDATDPPLDALRLLGAAAERIGDTDTAAAAFLRVVDRTTMGRAGTTRDDGASPGDWANLVRIELRAGRGAAALDFARRAVTAHPDQPVLRILAARCHLARGELAEAGAELETTVRRFPAVIQARLLQAYVTEKMGYFERAEELFAQALADLPEHAERTRSAYFEFLARTGRGEEAEAGLLELIAADPTDPDGYLRLGDFYLKLDPPRRDAARDQYERAAQLAPDSPAPLLRLGELFFTTAADDATALVALQDLVVRFEEQLPKSDHVAYVRGKLALVEGNPERAVELLKTFVERRPGESAGHYYLGLASHAAGDLAGATLALQECLRRRPDHEGVRVRLAAVQYELGLQKFRDGDFEAARALFAQAEAGGALQGNRILLAGAHANAGRLDVSERQCRELLEEEPDNRIARHLLSALLLRKGTVEALVEAETLFRELRASDSEDVLAIVGLATVQFQRRLYELAEQTFREAYALVPGDPGVALGLAQCLGLQQKASEAVEFLDAEAKAHPESDSLLQIKGDFLVHLELFEQAIPSFLAAFELNPDNTGALLAAAAATWQTGDLASARQLLVENANVRVTPELVQVALADVLLRMGRVDEARDACRRCLQLVPDFHRALLLLGHIAEEEGALAEARGFYARLVRLRAVTPEPYVRLAQILVSEGKPDEAIHHYRTALELDPRDASSLNNLALLLGEQEDDLGEAIGLAERAYKLRPDIPELLDTYGWLLFREGRMEEAAAALRRAANLLMGDAEVQYHAGMALSRVGDVEDARRLLNRALNLNPDLDAADVVRRELERLR